MCMIFAVSSKDSFEANDYLNTFFSNSDKHPHGWGLAYLRSDNMVIKKECVQASRSKKLADTLRRPLRSPLILAHIRYATIGNVEQANCHPFSGLDARHNRWTLIHNGTIFDYPPLSRFIKKQKGETDSERVFLYILNEVGKTAGSDFHERFALLDRIVGDMAGGNKLNLLFTDGEYLYAHTNCRDTLFYLQEKGTVIAATQPLDGKPWRKMPMCTLLAFKDGELIVSGTPHGHEYTENAENVKMLYRIFSNL